MATAAPDCIFWRLTVDYVAHVRAESARFGQCLAAADLDRVVPTCPSWNAADLLWHLTEVQLFWAAIVQGRLDEPGAADAAKPERPADRADLLELFASAGRRLASCLETVPFETPVWTWADDKTVGFVARRQAHEALIHRLDAEMMVAETTPIDSALAADGVDEILTVMFGAVPRSANFVEDGRTARVEASDVGAVWNLRFGHLTGTEPQTGTNRTVDALVVAESRSDIEPEAVVRAGAGLLDSWLWGRADSADLMREGNPAVFEHFEKIVRAGIQ